MPVEKVCQVCGEKYSAPNQRAKTSKYCSKQCKAISERSGVVKTCLNCKKDFYIPKQREESAKYCSSKCRDEAKNGSNVICPVCGKEFYLKPSRLKRGCKNPVTCSRECAHELLKKRLMKTCIVCGKEFETRDNEYRRDAKYCSNECCHKDRIGENHPGYKHGYGSKGTPEQRKARALESYNRHWEERYDKNRKKRFKRYNTKGSHTVEEWKNLLEQHDYKCYYCGRKMNDERNNRGKDKATREHKIPLMRGGTDNIDNIVPACRSCNSSKGNMTHDEFIEYLKRMNE